VGGGCGGGRTQTLGSRYICSVGGIVSHRPSPDKGDHLMGGGSPSACSLITVVVFDVGGSRGRDETMLSLLC
jgi:hypothetical protein